MTKEEVSKLSNEELLNSWEQIKSAFRLGLQSYLSGKQFNILFADFVNVSNEIKSRNLKLVI